MRLGKFFDKSIDKFATVPLNRKHSLAPWRLPHGFGLGISCESASLNTRTGAGRHMLTEVTPAQFRNSVVAVPPLALTPDFDINPAANAAQIRHLETGGVTTLLYGGNANVQNWPVSRFSAWLDVLEDAADNGSWLIPSVGPDYGKLVDEAAILKTKRYPVAMALPLTAPQNREGVLIGLEDFVQRSGVPLIVYIKSDNYVAPEGLARLKEQGMIFGIKYAVPRKNLSEDAYLQSLIDALGRDCIISGFGEPPALRHLMDFDLAGFTAGCVCIAPTLSTQFMRALQARNEAESKRLLEPFLPLEAIRERAHPIRVLHTAVTFSRVADMGPILPLLTEADPSEHAAIREAAETLMAAEMAARSTTPAKTVSA